MRPKTLEKAVLLLLVVYCLDLVWRLANWGDLANGVPWWGIALGLTVRVAFMAGLVFLLIRTRRANKANGKP
jgi:hypothetical protein